MWEVLTTPFKAVGSLIAHASEKAIKKSMKCHDFSTPTGICKYCGKKPEAATEDNCFERSFNLEAVSTPSEPHREDATPSTPMTPADLGKTKVGNIYFKSSPADIDPPPPYLTPSTKPALSNPESIERKRSGDTDQDGPQILSVPRATISSTRKRPAVDVLSFLNDDQETVEGPPGMSPPSRQNKRKVGPVKQSSVSTTPLAGASRSKAAVPLQALCRDLQRSLQNQAVRSKRSQAVEHPEVDILRHVVRALDTLQGAIVQLAASPGDRASGNDSGVPNKVVVEGFLQWLQSSIIDCASGSEAREQRRIINKTRIPYLLSLIT